MASKRIQKINSLIKKELSQIIFKEIDFPRNFLVTLTRTSTTQDLKEAKVWISTIPEKNSKLTLELLNKNINTLQQKLNKRLKIRIIPKIKFLEEKKTVEASRIEKILQSL